MKNLIFMFLYIGLKDPIKYHDYLYKFYTLNSMHFLTQLDASKPQCVNST